MNALTEMLNATTHHHVLDADTSFQAEKVAALSLNKASLLALNDPVLEDPADEQTRLGTLRRTFLSLPATELSVYGALLEELQAHGQEPIPTDSALAASLQVAWDQRQQELKAAMDSMVKPVQLMTRLIEAVRRTKRSDAEAGSDGQQLSTDTELSRVSALDQLQDILDDVDHARDFHTVGGFEALYEVLDPQAYSPDTDEEQGLAALSLGNAIKNQYDFQRWILEPTSQPTLLRRLLHLLAAGSDKSRRRALYAISSAARGNLDVQAAMCELQAADPDASIGTMLLQEMAGGAEMQRKALAFAADMVEEHTYIQRNKEYPGDLADQGLPEEQAQAQAADIFAQLNALKPVGAHFCSAEWARAGFRAMRSSIQLLQARGQGDPEGALPSEHSTARAVVENAVTMLEKLAACPGLSLQVTDAERRILHDVIARTQAAGDIAGDIAMNAQSLLNTLSQK